ncbi:MAG: hypothetical protein KGS09_18640 [Nitrospirae bacterium]|nr:hypothetical protein [Nitrospirota bacterium]MBU6482545.1 hypothetical protein [Nitrospirota bacterium]MDE3042031.1 hypothetical protein [Nitrospirota bacterium]
MKQFLNVRIGLGLIFLGMIACFLPNAPASADILQFSFTGAVSDVNSSLFPTFNNGQTLFGSITVDSSTPDTNSSGPISQYNNAIKNLTLSLGPMINATLGATDNSIQIHHFASFDRYAIGAPLTGSPVPVIGVTPVSFNFDGDASPAFPPSLSSFMSNHWRLTFSGAGNPTILGSLTSLTLTSVPLPAAVILFGTGLVALAGLGAGNWRRQKTGLA